MPGINAQNRLLLTALHRRFSRPFSVVEASEALAIPSDRARRLLGHLASRGWLARIKRGTYSTVPLDATQPQEWRADPWVVAAVMFAPCYLGGWTAAEHWSLTEQLFRDIIVVTHRRVRHRTIEIQQNRFLLKVISLEKIFGAKPVWRGQNRIEVSDPTRTVVDILDEPRIGGGIRHCAEVLSAYFASDHRNEKLLVEYIFRVQNHAVFKRLGYLAEVLHVGTPELIELCRKNISAGVSALDPSIRSSGHIVNRWNLRVNAAIDLSRPS
jgi:predicted transcriptional regulator of viral defense system